MCRFIVGAALVLLALAIPAQAADWYVATTGDDTAAGLADRPFATVKHAFEFAQPGDTINVRAGTYTTMQYIEDKTGSPGRDITVRACDGDLTASFDHGFFLMRCSYIRLVGLDFTISPSAKYAFHPLHITGGSHSPHRTHHMAILRCRFHDWSVFAQVKLAQADYILYEDCEGYHDYDKGPVIHAWVDVDYSTIRRDYLHDSYGDGAFTKGGGLYCVFEDNVVVRPQGGQQWGLLPGSQTGTAARDPEVLYESMYTVIRNNIIQGASRGAVPSEDSAYCYVYNNLFHDCAGLLPKEFSYITMIEAASEDRQWTRYFYIFNNIFYDTTGKMRPYGYVLSRGGGNCQYDFWQTGHNNFYNAGRPLVHETDTPDPTTEAGATYGDPHLSMTGTPDSWQGWVDYYRPKWDAQSKAMLRATGSATTGVPRDRGAKDIEGKAQGHVGILGRINITSLQERDWKAGRFLGNKDSTVFGVEKISAWLARLGE